MCQDVCFGPKLPARSHRPRAGHGSHRSGERHRPACGLLSWRLHPALRQAAAEEQHTRWDSIVMMIESYWQTKEQWTKLDHFKYYCVSQKYFVSLFPYFSIHSSVKLGLKVRYFNIFPHFHLFLMVIFTSFIIVASALLQTLTSGCREWVACRWTPTSTAMH